MAKRPLQPDDLYRLKDAASPRLSPDGSSVVFVVTSADRKTDANHTAIWSVGVSGGNAEPLTRGTNDSSPRFSPDGSQLAFIRSDGGAPQIWCLPSAGGEARKLTDFPLGVASAVWSADGSRLAVLAPVDIDGEAADDDEKQRRAHAPVVIRRGVYKADGTGLIASLRVHLFVVDADTGEAEELTKDDISASGCAWSPDGKRIAFAASTADLEVAGRSHLFVVDARGGAIDEVAAWPADEGTAFGPLFSQDGKQIVFVGQATNGAGHSRLFTIPATGGEPVELLSGFDRNVMLGGPAYPGASPAFSSDGALLFCARDRGCTHIYSARPGVTKAEVTKIAGGADRVVSSFNIAGDRLTYLVSSPKIPSDVFVARTDGSDEQRLTDVNEELLSEVKLHVPEERSFTAPDGKEIHGWLMRGAKTGTAAPLLLDVHGGPHNAWNPAFIPGAHMYADVLATQGWNVLMVNPRGSDGYGEDFMTAVVGEWGTSDENDFLCAIDELIEEGTADPKRLAVCGYSYGGFMTNWLTARTDRFAAAVSGGCVSNQASIYGSSDLGFYLGVYELGAELHEDRDKYAKHSPLTYIEGVTAPTLILHGERDDRCPVGQAEEWFAGLKRLGREVEFVRYPGASHLFIVAGRPSHRVDYSERIVAWLEDHV